MMTKEQLLHKAIECYQKAGMIDDACRCFEQLGEHLQAARLHEQQKRWDSAAKAYQRMSAWLDAARCYLHGEQPVKAAEGFLNGDEPFQAAWTYAEHAHRFYRTRAILQDTSINSLADELSHDVILARCEVGNGFHQKAGVYIYNVINRFLQLPLSHRQHIEQWAVTVAQHLSRFDLIASMYAVAYTTGTPDTEKRWEAWALATLGDASGVPTTPSIPPDSLFEFETVTVNKRGEIINRSYHQATQMIEQVNGVEIEMVYVPGGTFIMGSPEDEGNNWEKPQHQVTVAPFYMGKYPVTQSQWQAVMGNNPSEFKGENHPVENVSWDETVEFGEKLSKITEQNYQLPSEAQWEYACRAGTTTPFYFGETMTTDLANYEGIGINSYASELEGIYREQTTEVGIFPPNVFGLYDMHGNVFEWCADLWHQNYEGAHTDGSVWKTDGEEGHFVLRGGSWNGGSWWARAALRDWRPRIGRDGEGGVRLVRII